MTETLITFETSKLAKEKGFIQHGFRNYYFVNRDGSYFDHEFNDVKEKISIRENHFARPTQSLLQRWLREKHSIEIMTYRTLENMAGDQYGCEGEKWGEYMEDLFNIYAKTYEGALEKGLLETLKLI